MNGSRPGQKRVPYIDGLRGLAALAVFWAHGPMLMLTSAGPHDPWKFFSQIGDSGVELFFVLSGFCLSYPLLASEEKRLDLLRFASHRIVRIMPPFYACLAILATIYFLAGDHRATIPPWGAASIQPVEVLKEALFIDIHTAWLTPQFWTLPVELRWYFLFPVVLWLWIARRRVFGFLLVGALVVIHVGLQFGDALALPAFMLGIVAADFKLKRRIDDRIALLAFAGLLVLTLAVEWHGQTGLPWRLRYTLWEFTAFAFVVLAGTSRWVQRPLQSPVMVFIGGMSYSLYLMHMAPMVWVYTSFPQLSPLFRTVIGMVAGFIVSVGFWWAFERPFTETALKGIATARVRAFLARAARMLEPRSSATKTAPRTSP